jgi:hypothetical protein
MPLQLCDTPRTAEIAFGQLSTVSHRGSSDFPGPGSCCDDKCWFMKRAAAIRTYTSTSGHSTSQMKARSAVTVPFPGELFFPKNLGRLVLVGAFDRGLARKYLPVRLA